MNQINNLELYRTGITWAFDDIATGLEREPFVSGIPEILDSIIPEKEKRVFITFSKEFFPTHSFQINLVGEDRGGAWYEFITPDDVYMRGWLCPALFKYFETAPKTIYFSIDY